MELHEKMNSFLTSLVTIDYSISARIYPSTLHGEIQLWLQDIDKEKSVELIAETIIKNYTKFNVFTLGISNVKPEQFSRNRKNKIWFPNAGSRKYSEKDLELFASMLEYECDNNWIADRNMAAFNICVSENNEIRIVPTISTEITYVNRVISLAKDKCSGLILKTIAHGKNPMEKYDELLTHSYKKEFLQNTDMPAIYELCSDVYYLCNGYEHRELPQPVKIDA